MNKYLILYKLTPTEYEQKRPEESRQNWKLYMIEKGENAEEALKRSRLLNQIAGIKSVATVPWEQMSIWEQSGWTIVGEKTE